MTASRGMKYVTDLIILLQKILFVDPWISKGKYPHRIGSSIMILILVFSA